MNRRSRSDKAVSSRQKILESALGLFVERGYHGTSLQSIAEKAGVNKALLFYYFDSKENLFDMAFQTPQEKSLEKMKAESSKINDPEERLKFLIDAYLELFESMPELLHIALMEVSSTNESSRARMKKFIERGIKPIEETIGDGIQKGCFKKIDPRMASIFLMGMMRIFGVQERVTGVKFNTDEISGNVKQIFLQGLSSECGKKEA